MRFQHFTNEQHGFLPKRLFFLVVLWLSFCQPLARAQTLGIGLDVSAALQLDCGLQLTLSSNLPSCEGNTVCLNLLGGLPPYKIWVDGQYHSTSLLGLGVCISNLNVGEHVVKVTDLRGCESDLTLKVPSLGELLKPVIKPATCHGIPDGSISLDLSLLVGINVSNLLCRWEGPEGYRGEGREIHDLRPGRYTVRLLAVGNICIGTSSWEVPGPTAEPIKINISIANAACGTANACAYISGGKAPYRIWGYQSLPGTVHNGNFLDFVRPNSHREEDCTVYNPTTTNTPFCVNNLSAGYYYILVQDANGCYAWQVFKINPSARFERQVRVKNISCAGATDGEICFDIAGNTPPYQTTLTKTDGTILHTIAGTAGCFENLQANEYLLVTSDGSGCVSKEKIKIVAPEELTAVFVVEENNCQEGAKGCLKIKGGTRPYQISAWFYPNGSDRYEVNYQQDGTPYVRNATRCDYFNFPPVWSSSADFCVRNLPPGKYILLVVDAHHCFETIVVEIPDFEDLEAKFELTSGSCDEWGSGCLTIEGGIQPYNVFVFSTNSVLSVIPTVRFDATGKPHLSHCQPTQWQWSTPGIAPPYQICASDLPPGYYWILVVDKNGCYERLPVHVPSPNKVILSTRVQNVSCNGEKNGKIFLTINGGTAPYTLTVNGTVYHRQADSREVVLDSLKAGVYKIDVKDKNGCSAWIEVKITDPEPLAAVFIFDQQNACSAVTGGCVQVQGGTGPYQVRFWKQENPGEIIATVHFNASTNRWELRGALELNLNLHLPTPSAHNWCVRDLPPGQYTVLVTDANGCYTLVPIQIAEPNLLKISAGVVHSACSAVGGKVKLNIRGGAAPYQVKFGDRTVTTSDSLVWLENVPPGTYQIWVYDQRQCAADLKVTVKTEEIKANLHFDKFGEYACVNPSGGTAPYKVVFANIETGVPIAQDSCVSDLEPGVYLVTITDQSGCSIQHWFVIDPQPCQAGIVKINHEWISSGESVTFQLIGSESLSLQWQFRTAFTEWMDILGATGATFTTPPLHVAMDEVIYVRAKVTCANGGVGYTVEASFKVRGNNLLSPIDARIAHPQLFNPDFRRTELLLLQYNENQATTALVYPTVSRNQVKVQFRESSEQPVTLYLVNGLGSVVSTIRQPRVYAGEEVTVAVHSLSPGAYFICIENGKHLDTQRIVVQ